MQINVFSDGLKSIVHKYGVNILEGMRETLEAWNESQPNNIVEFFLLKAFYLSGAMSTIFEAKNNSSRCKDSIEQAVTFLMKTTSLSDVVARKAVVTVAEIVCPLDGDNNRIDYPEEVLIRLKRLNDVNEEKIRQDKAKKSNNPFDF